MVDSSPRGLTPADLAVLGVLVRSRGRVLGRASILRSAGLQSAPERRCDTSIVAIRRALGPDSVVTVRRRGWMLAESAIDTAKNLLTEPGPVRK